MGYLCYRCTNHTINERKDYPDISTYLLFRLLRRMPEKKKKTHIIELFALCKGGNFNIHI